MARNAGPRKVNRYTAEFKMKAVKLRSPLNRKPLGALVLVRAFDRAYRSGESGSVLGGLE